MTKLVIIGAILSTLVLADAAEQPRLEGKLDQRAEAPAYGPGDGWVFKVDRFSLKQSSIDQIGKGGEFALAPGKGKLEVFSLEEGKQIPVTRPQELRLLLPHAGVRQGEAKYYDFPLFVGKKWDSKFGKFPHLTAHNEVTAIETVTTPAGTFQAYKIERLYANSMLSGDIRRFWWTSYYSPETRSLVKFNYEHNTLICGAYERIDAELVRYGSGKTIPPRPIDKENYVAIPTTSTASPPPTITIKLDGDDKSDALRRPKVKEPNVIAIPKLTPATPEANADKSNSPAEPKAEAVTKKTNVPGGNLTLGMNIIGQRKEADGSYGEVLIRDGSLLRSRDNFQVHLETNRPAYVYILLYDSRGKASQLFPDPKINHSGLTDGGAKLVVPDANMWFWLDEDTGTETIFMLASEKPMTEIRALLARMEKADDIGQQRGSQEIAKKIFAMQRGIGGVTKGPAATYQLSDGKKIEKIMEIVSGAGAVVRSVSFRHADAFGQPAQARGQPLAAVKTRGGC